MVEVVAKVMGLSKQADRVVGMLWVLGNKCSLYIIFSYSTGYTYNLQARAVPNPCPKSNKAPRRNHTSRLIDQSHHTQLRRRPERLHPPLERKDSTEHGSERRYTRLFQDIPTIHPRSIHFRLSRPCGRHVCECDGFGTFPTRNECRTKRFESRTFAIRARGSWKFRFG